MFACAAVITLCASCAHSAGSPSSASAVTKEINAKAKALKSDGDSRTEVYADLIEAFPEFFEQVEQTIEQYFGDGGDG
jgi:hypothetical protein